MRTITINQPRIVLGIDDGHCRLSSTIESDHFTKDLYFEVENKYKQYLCPERGDAFMLELLNFALVNGYNMDIKVPVSEKLYYQLIEQYIPTLVQYRPDRFQKIAITAPLDSSHTPNEGAVGASASGGVDSFYTILKNVGGNVEKYNVTHLLVSPMYNAYYGEEKTRERFKNNISKGQEIAKALHLQLVAVFSNENEFWYKECISDPMFKNIAYVYALHKLFSVYHFSATYNYGDFSIEKGSAHHEFLIAQMISSEDMTVYSSGFEVSRTEKVEFIADNPVVQNQLYVCNFSASNCCTCSKCMRTQMELWSIGKLDKFSKVFPEKNFESRKNKELCTIISRKNEYDKYILTSMEKHGLKIPLGVRVGGLMRYNYLNVRHLLKKNKFLKRVHQRYLKDRLKVEYSPNNTRFHETDSDYAARYNDIVF